MTELSKLEVAQRQLVTAIRLFLQDDEPVSIYTLASNAWEVIDALCTERGIDSISNETRGHIPAHKDLKRHYINDPYRNFFKHADRDFDEILGGFDDTKNDAVLFLAAEDYMRMQNKSPVEFQVYQLWFLSLNVDKIAPGDMEDVMGNIERHLPRIENMSRTEQKKMGQELLAEAWADEDLAKHPKVEIPIRS